MHVVQLFVVSTLKCVLSGTFYHIQNDLKFFPSKTGNKIIIALAGKSSVVEELRNKILTEEIQSPNYNLHVSFGYINAKFLDIQLSVTTCHWCRNVKQSVTSGTRKILKICSVHLLPLFRAISPEENSNTLRNALLTWRRAMANQMRHRGVSFIELCSGLKLKVAISCLLAYYVYLKSGDMWAVGGKAKPLQSSTTPSELLSRERDTLQKNICSTMAASPSSRERTEPTTG